MLKRYLLLALCLVLVVSAAPVALADADCDAIDSHYARAVQLHDMGDYGPALRHYNCALAEDPDNPTIPILIENLREDIVSMPTAWSADASAPDAAQPAPTGFVMPDWLTPYEHVRAPQAQQPAPQAAQPAPMPAPVQPIVIFAQHSQLLMQTDETLIIRDADTLTYWRRLQTLFVERVQVVISTGETTLTLFRQRSFAMIREARLTIQLPPPQSAGDAGMEFDDYLDFATWFSKRDDLPRAAKSLERALELQPHRHNVRCRLGAIYRELGYAAAAMAQFDHVLANDSGNTCAFENRQDMLESTRTPFEKRALLATTLSRGR